MKNQHTDEPFTDFLAQVAERDFQRYREEFRQEQLEIYRARLKKEAEQTNKTENIKEKSESISF